MAREEKEVLLQEVKDLISSSSAVFAAEYRGLSVAKVTELRRKVKETGNRCKVVKNTLVEVAFRQLGMFFPEELLEGPNMFFFATGDPVALAKVLVDFSKENELLKLKGGAMGRSAVSADGIKALSQLPPREVLIAQLVGTFAAPIRNLLSVLSGPMRGLVNVLSRVKEQKESA